ncbi:type II secretion system F family protein [Alicyclobacillus macrosporangiidus]|uniref:Tight adherence protein B n=1 Tax=Alicyclobacillus macrosporangiidus TaxID=392015 RepID=A0A1I7L8W4_9BACL|nr:type II secretion system F family protein [Alicyclobacillus macrosporangiidus]SFV06151.1 tight adherence protein B [Alicyclobacillus macrosporangiidus]
MIAQLIGLLAGLALLCFFIESDLRRAHRESLWLASLRERYHPAKSRIPALDRLAYETKEGAVNMTWLVLVSVAGFFVASVLLSLAEESVAFGILVSLAGTIGGAVGWIRYRYRKRKRVFFDSLLREAMPIAITTLRATNRLEAAFEDVASIARDKRVKEEFEALAKTWRGLHVTPEQALGLTAARWEIDEMVQLARATEEAVKYHANLAELWLKYREQIERDEDKRRKLRAKTLAGRRNGLIYSGIVVAMFGLAYPRAHPYMTPIANTGFWVVLLILLACTWAIWRAGEVIEV